MDDTQRKSIATDVNERFPADVQVTFREGKGGPGQPVFTISGYTLKINGVLIRNVMMQTRDLEADKLAARIRRAICEQNVRGYAIAERVTEELHAPNMRVEFKHFGSGKGYTFWAGQAASTPAKFDASYEEVLAGAKKLAARKGNQFSANPQSRGSVGQPYFQEKG